MEVIYKQSGKTPIFIIFGGIVTDLPVNYAKMMKSGLTISARYDRPFA